MEVFIFQFHLRIDYQILPNTHIFIEFQTGYYLGEDNMKSFDVI